MPSVEGAASPGFALLVTVTSRHYLYVGRARSCSVTRLRKHLGNHERRRSIIENIRNTCERSGVTLNELGEGLGYDGPTAKKRAWFLLYRTSDPRISAVLAVAQPLDVKISDPVK